MLGSSFGNLLKHADWPPDLVIDVECQLANPWLGCSRLLRPHADAVLCMQDTLEIEVQPGWKSGTRIRFPGKGDSLPGQPPQVRASPCN